MAEPTLTANTVEELLDRLASGAPTPGGGSASALAGALAAALVSMVCNLTLGRPKLSALEEGARALLGQSETLRRLLTDGVQADAHAYAALLAAFRLPRDTPPERASRAEAVQRATAVAARVPLEIAEQCGSVLELCGETVGRTNPNAASDIAVAALLAQAGLEGAAANVEVNLPSIRDETASAEIRHRLAAVRVGVADRVADVARQTRGADGS